VTRSLIIDLVIFIPVILLGYFFLTPKLKKSWPILYRALIVAISVGVAVSVMLDFYFNRSHFVDRLSDYIGAGICEDVLFRDDCPVPQQPQTEVAQAPALDSDGAEDSASTVESPIAGPDVSGLSPLAEVAGDGGREPAETIHPETGWPVITPALHGPMPMAERPAIDLTQLVEAGGDDAPAELEAVPPIAAAEHPPAVVAPDHETSPDADPAHETQVPTDDQNELFAGDVFRDCDGCPEMVVILGGSFAMGSPESEGGRDFDEGPRHTVSVNGFALGRYEVTFAEYDVCVEAGGCSYRPDDLGWGRGSRPVLNVSWDNAQEYLGWLSRMTGQSYRLPSEAEWEYAARAGTTSARYWGENIGYGHANCTACGNYWIEESLDRLKPDAAARHSFSMTAPVGSYSPNDFGLFDMLGNAWEWTQDCGNYNYENAPSNGESWEAGNCSSRILRGGSFVNGTEGFVRSASRDRSAAGLQFFTNGFRAARDLTAASPAAHGSNAPELR